MAKKPAAHADEPENFETDPAPPPPATQLPEPPAPPLKTIADEQRARSDEIARAGVEKWKAAHDERTDEEKAGRQVPGVAPPAPNPEGGSWQGSTRTTPPARAAQNPAAPR